MNPSPHRVPRTSRSASFVPIATAAVAAAVMASVLVSGSPAGAETAAVSPTGSLAVTLRGNGHGHGMSQYGAQGAAVRGLNYLQILKFYYPGTSAAPIAASTIRVRLSGFGKYLTVAAEKGLQATGWRGALPTAGVSKYAIVPWGTGFALQQLPAGSGAKWRNVRTGLAGGSAFARPGTASVRVLKPSGASTRYLGVTKIFRSGSKSYLVNRTSLDNYTAGVVAREMPVSWRPQAVNAQAVAARSYGRYAVENERGRTYDICDTTQCQVYGGHAQYSRSGRRLTTDYQPAAKATANRVLRYKGKTIFAQFAASNGGYIADGGKPYLRAKADPYDAGAPNNPYRNYSRTVSVQSLAGHFGFGKLTGISVVKRDGGGAWGGRVQSVVLTGTGAGKAAKRVTVSGLDLQWAMGAGTTLLTVRRG